MIVWDSLFRCYQAHFIYHHPLIPSLVAQTVKRLPTMLETWVRSLGQEDPLQKEMTTHSSTLAWKILWVEEPGGLQCMGLQRVGHNRVTTTQMGKLRFGEIKVLSMNEHLCFIQKSREVTHFIFSISLWKTDYIVEFYIHLEWGISIEGLFIRMAQWGFILKKFKWLLETPLRPLFQ